MTEFKIGDAIYVKPERTRYRFSLESGRRSHLQRKLGHIITHDKPTATCSDSYQIEFDGIENDNWWFLGKELIHAIQHNKGKKTMTAFKKDDKVKINPNCTDHAYSSTKALNLLKTGAIGIIEKIDSDGDPCVRFTEYAHPITFTSNSLILASENDKSWKFHSSAKGDVNYLDILDCLTHDNPIAIMTITDFVQKQVPYTEQELLNLTKTKKKNTKKEKTYNLYTQKQLNTLKKQDRNRQLLERYTFSELTDLLKTATEKKKGILHPEIVGKLHILHTIKVPTSTYTIAIHTSLLHKGDVCQIFGETDGETLYENEIGLVLEASQSDFTGIIKWAKRVKHAKWPKELRRDATVSVKMPTI